MAPATSTSSSPKPNNASMELVLHNSDLLREILLRLPAKSLVKLQSVCKEWLSLIYSAEFGQQHTIRGPKLQQQSLIIQTRGIRRQWYHLNPSSRRMTSLIPTPHDDVILQSSNGLLLLQNRSWKNHYFVHNPATKQSRMIIPPRSDTHPYIAEAALAFDPSKSPYYKFVCVRRSSYFESPCGYQIEVYSSETHTWNEATILEQITLPSTIGIPSSFSLLDIVRVYWNNTIFWSSKSGSRYCCLDIAKREWKTLPFPPTLYYHDYSGLQESNGHLFHIELMGVACGHRLVEVWELDDDHRWLLRHHHVVNSTPPTSRWELLTCFTFLVDTCSLLVFPWRGCLRVYNLKLGSYESFLDATGKPFFDTDSRAFQFGGTLALV